MTLKYQKIYADRFYNENRLGTQWGNLIKSLLDEPRAISKGLVYDTNSGRVS